MRPLRSPMRTKSICGQECGKRSSRWSLIDSPPRTHCASNAISNKGQCTASPEEAGAGAIKTASYYLRYKLRHARC